MTIEHRTQNALNRIPHPIQLTEPQMDLAHEIGAGTPLSELIVGIESGVYTQCQKELLFAVANGDVSIEGILMRKAELGTPPHIV